VTATTHPEPTPESVADLVAAARRDGAVVTLQAACEVDYEGRSGGHLGPGDRLVVVKADGTVLVHRPTGLDPVNWQPAGGSVRVETDPTCRLVARRSAPRERLVVHLEDVYAATRFDAEDAADYRAWGTEADLHRTIIEDPETVEAGLRVVEHERETRYGALDFFATDADGNPVVVEVKRRAGTLDDLDQLRRYVGLYEETNPDVRGMLVAPTASDRVRRALADHGLEFVPLVETALDREVGTDASLSDFQ
jgi:hypothetical protein